MSDDAAYWHGKYVQAEARVGSTATALEEMERLYNKSADRIEALEAENERLRKRLNETACVVDAGTASGGNPSILARLDAGINTTCECFTPETCRATKVCRAALPHP